MSFLSLSLLKLNAKYLKKFDSYGSSQLQKTTEMLPVMPELCFDVTQLRVELILLRGLSVCQCFLTSHHRPLFKVDARLLPVGVTWRLSPSPPLFLSGMREFLFFLLLCSGWFARYENNILD